MQVTQYSHCEPIVMTFFLGFLTIAITAFLRPLEITLYLGAILQGIGSGIVWTVCGHFLAVNSTSTTIGRSVCHTIKPAILRSRLFLVVTCSIQEYWNILDAFSIWVRTFRNLYMQIVSSTRIDSGPAMGESTRNGVVNKETQKLQMGDCCKLLQSLYDCWYLPP